MCKITKRIEYFVLQVRYSENVHLIVDNVFSNIVVDFFQWVWVSTSPGKRMLFTQ